MAGAIAGTAIIKASNLSENIHTITLTINNDCNMSCPHCYLHCQSNSNVISKETINSIFKSNFKHIAIVGKEPLYNSKSIDTVNEIATRVKNKGATISIVTNGLNLRKLPKSLIELIDYVDVSFDGGKESYHKFRKGDINKIIEGVNYLNDNGINEVNALHTLCNINQEYITDCINVKDLALFKNIMFSPFLVTENYGFNTVHRVPLIDIMSLIIKNDSFMTTKGAFLLLDCYHVEQDNFTQDIIEEFITNNCLEDKIRFYKKDPLFHGIIRITFDDLILSPRLSINPKNYNRSTIKASETNIDIAFSKMLINELEYAY